MPILLQPRIHCCAKPGCRLSAVRLAPCHLIILVQVCGGLSGLRVPVSPGVVAVSPRIVVNNTGSLCDPLLTIKGSVQRDVLMERVMYKQQNRLRRKEQGD